MDRRKPFASGQEQDEQEQRLRRLEQRGSRDGQEDVVIDYNRRLMLRSPNGHYWAVTVDNAGALSTVDMGTSL